MSLESSESSESSGVWSCDGCILLNTPKGLFEFANGGEQLLTGPLVCIVARGWEHSSSPQSILWPLYFLVASQSISPTLSQHLATYRRLIMQFFAMIALSTEFVSMWQSPLTKVTLITTRLWICSRSSRIECSVWFGWHLYRMMLRLAPILSLLAIWLLRTNCRSFHLNSTYSASAWFWRIPHRQTTSRPLMHKVVWRERAKKALASSA